MSDHKVGMGGYAHRPAADTDPLVCVCGSTIGTRALTKAENADRLKAVKARHAPECARRLAHQQRHRGPADTCPDCPRPEAANG